MNALRGFAPLIAAAVVLASPATARATGQELDAVRFEGQRHFMLEVPLAGLLWERPDVPDFDWPRTSNWKGYTAAWEVKDGGLYLASFEAKANGKDYPVEALFPGRKLPILADWYTGRIRIPIGEPTEYGPRGGIYGAVYPRVVVLHLVKGKVVRSEELKNFRIKSWSDERDAERARHWLWSFPRLAAGTALTFSIPDLARAAVVVVPPHVVRRTPAWAKDGPDPPLSAMKAMLRAEAASRQYLPPGARFTWRLSDIKLKPATGDWYFYEASFWPEPPEVSQRFNASLRLIVLMDGTVPRPDFYPAGELVRTLREGGFTVEGVPTESRQASWEWSDYGAPWSEIPGWARAPLVISMLAAPKLLHTVEKLEVYRNGVWAEYTVTNGSRDRKYVPPERLHVPLRNAGLWDDAGVKWPIPQSNEPAGVGKPSEFVPIEPRQSVRYRVHISHPSLRTLQPFGLVESRKPGRPAALEYFIHAWPNVFTRPSEESEAQVLAFGYGRVPVTWSDQDYPKEWPRQQRLDR